MFVNYIFKAKSYNKCATLLYRTNYTTRGYLYSSGRFRSFWPMGWYVIVIPYRSANIHLYHRTRSLWPWFLSGYNTTHRLSGTSFDSNYVTFASHYRGSAVSLDIRGKWAINEGIRGGYYTLSFWKIGLKCPIWVCSSWLSIVSLNWIDEASIMNETPRLCPNNILKLHVWTLTHMKLFF